MRLLFLCALPLFAAAEIIKFDEEDMRGMRASDPFDLFTFPSTYAFSQALQLAKEHGYRYFSFVFYDCNLGFSQTTSYLMPPSISGEVLTYADEWISLEIIGYPADPMTLDVFDASGYKVVLGDQEIE